jgi:hypothetical protein
MMNKIKEEVRKLLFMSIIEGQVVDACGKS